jgi:hypothetical protein
MSSWVDVEARRTNRNLLLINGIIVAVLAAAAIANLKNIDYSGDFWPLLFLFLFFLLALWNCIKAVRRYGEIQTTPVWKHLSIYGSAEQISSVIEQELLHAQKAKYGDLQLTGSWMVQKNLFSTWASPVEDLAWVYKKVTKHSVNFIPTGKSYSIIILGRHRQRIEVSMPEKRTNELLAELATRVPWAIYGYQKELDAAWTKDPASVIALVNSRYEQLKASSSAASPSS